MIPRVVIPETFNCCEVRLVVEVTPKVLIPETFKFVAVINPTVVTPLIRTLPWTVSFDVGFVVPIPTLKLLLPLIQELASEPITNWSEPVVFGNRTL